MTKLFVDIETVPDFTDQEYTDAERLAAGDTPPADPEEKEAYWKRKNGSLNPFQGKIILITYKINNGYVHRLMEWESGERAILVKFFNLIKNLQKGPSDDWLQIIGHNILGFDLLFLYERMKHHGIDDARWIYHYLLKKPDVADILQIHLSANAMQRRGLKHDILADAYGLPQKEDQGGNMIEQYYNKNYDAILEYSEKEFIYDDIYDRILTKGMVSAKELSDAISRYNERQEFFQGA